MGHAKGELGLSMTSEYAGRETLEAKRLRAGREVARIGEPWGREGNQMATANELREALRDERARVADLRKRVQDNKYLRFCLVSASGVLHIVEHAISPATMAQPHMWNGPRCKELLNRFHPRGRCVHMYGLEARYMTAGLDEIRETRS